MSWSIYFTFFQHKKGGRGEGDGEGASDRGGEPAVYAGGAGRGLEGGAFPLPGTIVSDVFLPRNRTISCGFTAGIPEPKVAYISIVLDKFCKTSIYGAVFIPRGQSKAKQPKIRETLIFETEEICQGPDEDTLRYKTCPYMHYKWGAGESPI